MRIAFDLGPTRGRRTGIGIYTDALMRALRAYVPQTDIVMLDDGAGVDQRTDRRIVREQIILPRLAKQANADLIHLTGFAAPLRSRVPIVLTVMDLIGVLLAKNFPPVSRFYWSIYLPFTLRAPRHLVTPSHNTKRDVVRLAQIPPHRISVVPPGIESRFHPVPDTALREAVRLRLALPARFFLFVSTLEPRKGIDTLLAAYEKIASHVPEHLVIVGKRGWYFSGLYTQVRKAGLELRVHFADYVSDDDLPALYNLATAFVFPSHYEGFGLTVLEAMACGTPVISSNASSLPEVVGEAGILVTPNNVTGFAHAMSYLAANEAPRAELRKRGLERAQMFSWERTALEMQKVYESIVTQTPLARAPAPEEKPVTLDFPL